MGVVFPISFSESFFISVGLRVGAVGGSGESLPIGRLRGHCMEGLSGGSQGGSCFGYLLILFYYCCYYYNPLNSYNEISGVFICWCNLLYKNRRTLHMAWHFIPQSFTDPEQKWKEAWPSATPPRNAVGVAFGHHHHILGILSFLLGVCETLYEMSWHVENPSVFV